VRLENRLKELKEKSFVFSWYDKMMAKISGRNGDRLAMLERTDELLLRKRKESARRTEAHEARTDVHAIQVASELENVRALVDRTLPNRKTLDLPEVTGTEAAAKAMPATGRSPWAYAPITVGAAAARNTLLACARADVRAGAFHKQQGKRGRAVACH